jgi:hypothetical protein
MQDRSDVEVDAVVQASSVGEDLDRTFGASGEVNGDKPVVGRRSLGVSGDQVLAVQGLPQCGDYLGGFLVIDLGEQVDVLGSPGHEPMGDHGATARQCERAGFGEGQGGAGDAFL